jgi:hypothetical protein
MLTPGNVDVTTAPDLLARMGQARYVLCDKGYDADPLSSVLRQRGLCPSTHAAPAVGGRFATIVSATKAAFGRNAFCRLKDLRRSDAHYDVLTSSLPTSCQA